MARTNLLFAASAASVACLAIFALTGCNPAQPVTAAAAEPAKPVGQQHSTPTEPEIGGTWYKVGDDRETFIAIGEDWFARGDAVAGRYLEGRSTVKERNDDGYELHVKYAHGLNGVSEETLIIKRHVIKRQGEAIVVFGPNGKEKGEYRREKPEPVIRIHAHDLGGINGVRSYRRKVLIIGQLGRPLHTMMTVRGVWHYPVRPGKDYSLLFRVTHVDGQALERPVTFHGAFVHERYPKDEQPAKTEPSEGEKWEMKAFESGHFEGVAPGWDEALGTGPVGRLFHGFVTELYGVVVQVESASKPGK